MGLRRDMTDWCRRERIGAVIGYVFNGLIELGIDNGSDGQPRSFFETMNIPHLLLWIDHPQWAAEKTAIQPQLQPLLRSRNNHHFLKSDCAAHEVERVLGWPNCHGLSVAEDPEQIVPVTGIAPDWDVVAILGSPPRLDANLIPFLDQDTPDVGAIADRVADTVREKLSALWRRDAPSDAIDRLTKLGHDWVALRRADDKTASVRHLPELTSNHQDAARWLLANPKTYFDAIEHLWLFGGWQRTFYLRYLAKYFRVGVFGNDWSSIGIAGGGWVNHHAQAACYARGKIAINISQGSDEEGLALKPFQIAASGVPMIHNDRKGLADCFEVGREIEVFDSPAQARDIITELLNDPERRDAMAEAARRRLRRDHTWNQRLESMFALADLSIDSFRSCAVA